MVDSIRILEFNGKNEAGWHVGRIKILHLRGDQWVIQTGRNGPNEIGLHSAPFIHKEHETNVLALLKAGINSLEDWAFDDEVGSQDLARRQQGAGAEVQRWADRLRHHRPSLRRGQPEQPSGDEGG